MRRAGASTAHTWLFDAALEPHLAAGDQLVILGAGFDARAYRLPAGSRVRSFEVDTAETQAVKLASAEPGVVIELARWASSLMTGAGRS